MITKVKHKLPEADSHHCLKEMCVSRRLERPNGSLCYQMFVLKVSLLVRNTGVTCRYVDNRKQQRKWGGKWHICGSSEQTAHAWLSSLTSVCVITCRLTLWHFDKETFSFFHKLNKLGIINMFGFINAKYEPSEKLNEDKGENEQTFSSPTAIFGPNDVWKRTGCFLLV